MDTTPELIQLSPAQGVAIREQVALAALPVFFGRAYAELGACGRDQISGPPFAIYHAFGPDKVDVSAVMPVRGPVVTSGRVVAIDLPGGPAVQVKHIGSYDEMGPTYTLVENWIAEHHRARAGAVREMYLTPPSVPATQMVTLVIQPLQAT
jgi:effector-binding domain-containing protein